MKILLLVPVHDYTGFTFKKNELPKYQAHASWLRAMRSLGHEVVVYRYTDPVSPNLMPARIIFFFILMCQRLFLQALPRFYNRVRRLKDTFPYINIFDHIRNMQILNCARELKPDCVIFSGGSSAVFPSTLRQIKTLYGSRVILMSGVHPKFGATPQEKTVVSTGVADFVITNDDAYAEEWEKISQGSRGPWGEDEYSKKQLMTKSSPKVINLPISACDLSLTNMSTRSKNSPARSRPNSNLADSKLFSKRKYDVVFFGTINPERQKILNAIHKGLIEIGVSAGIDVMRQSTPGVGFDHLQQSKIAINLQPSDMSSGANMRTFEIPSCGALQVADKADPRIFTHKKNIILFSSPKEAAQLIKYYLENDKERIKIARAGCQLVTSHHTYQHRFTTLLSL